MGSGGPLGNDEDYTVRKQPQKPKLSLGIHKSIPIELGSIAYKTGSRFGE
jgi:hypothetical protein